MSEKQRRIGFVGLPPEEVLAPRRSEILIDLDNPLPGVAPDSEVLLPRTTCHILRRALDNARALDLDEIVIDVGPGKCDGARWLAHVLRDVLGIPVLCTENANSIGAGTPICDSDLPVRRKLELILDGLRFAPTPLRLLDPLPPSAALWGVPAADFSLYDLFPDGTQLLGWTRCLENRTPADEELECWVPGDAPTVFFSQNFCAKSLFGPASGAGARRVVRGPGRRAGPAGAGQDRGLPALQRSLGLMATLADFGTTWTKLLDLATGERRLLRTSEVGASTVEVATGHNARQRAAQHVNELVALAQGARRLISEPEFLALDVGSRDMKYVHMKGEELVRMDWTTTCGALTGFTLELLGSYYGVDYRTVAPSAHAVPVTCGVLGMEQLFELVAQGVSETEAVARFARGIAHNAHRFISEPPRFHLSGGMCDNPLFLRSFPDSMRNPPPGKVRAGGGAAGGIVGGEDRSHIAPGRRNSAFRSRT